MPTYEININVNGLNQGAGGNASGKKSGSGIVVGAAAGAIANKSISQLNNSLKANQKTLSEDQWIANAGGIMGVPSSMEEAEILSGQMDIFNQQTKASIAAGTLAVRQARQKRNIAVARKTGTVGVGLVAAGVGMYISNYGTYTGDSQKQQRMASSAMLAGVMISTAATGNPIAIGLLALKVAGDAVAFAAKRHLEVRDENEINRRATQSLTDRSRGDK